MTLNQDKLRGILWALYALDDDDRDAAAACDAIKAELSRLESRRDQRRARKAAKNLHMYKSCGKRPWNGVDESWDMIAWAARRLASPWILSAEPFPVYKRKMHEFFVKDLRGQSGFRDMSRRAEQVAFETAWLREHLAEFNRLSMSTLFGEATS